MADASCNVGSRVARLLSPGVPVVARFQAYIQGFQELLGAKSIHRLHWIASHFFMVSWVTILTLKCSRCTATGCCYRDIVPRRSIRFNEANGMDRHPFIATHVDLLPCIA